MQAALILSAVVLTGIGGTYLAQEPTPSPVVAQQVEELSPLERARRASFDIALPEYKVSGSAVLVSRVKLDSGKYRYRALTAYHVVEKMAKAIADDKLVANHQMLMTFQPEFHGQPLQFTLNIDDVDWAVPMQDWAAFTFESEHRLECADVATEEEFKAIKPFEPIYVVACDGPFGQQCRMGVMSATHNIAVWPKQQAKSPWPWHQNPENFFRIGSTIWYGDSGGAIFTKDGKLIGIINAFTMRYNDGWGGGSPVTHSGVALKAHIVRDMTKYSKDFFLVEN